MNLIPVFAALIALGQSSGIERFTQTDLHDITFTGKVEKADQTELAKVNSDFGQSYRFTTTTVHAKEPFKIRADASVEDTTAHYVINGNEKVIKLGTFRFKSNLSKSPGKRQTILDFGILTPSLFEDLYEAKFVRTERGTGEAVFDVSYQPQLKDTSHSRIWLDPAKKFITKREWYNQTGRELATFLYKNAVEVGGIWIPTRAEVYNDDRVLAGVTNYDNIKVNTGLDDDLFSVK